MNRRERLRRQEQLEREWASDQAERPNEPAPRVPLRAQCPAKLGSAHDFTMGGGRCWYCGRTKETAETGK